MTSLNTPDVLAGYTATEKRMHSQLTGFPTGTGASQQQQRGQVMKRSNRGSLKMRPLIPRPESAGAILSTSSTNSSGEVEAEAEVDLTREEVQSMEIPPYTSTASASAPASGSASAYRDLPPLPISPADHTDVKTPTHPPPPMPPSLSLSSSDPDSLWYHGDSDDARKTRRSGDQVNLTIDTANENEPSYDF